jgi:histidine triad (HIT) family protein
MVSEEDLESMSPEEIAEYQRQNCIFCKIIKGDIPSKKAYEDDKIISILDINPAAKGHLLLMTKEHYPILPVIPLDTAAHMLRATKHLAEALKQAMVTNKVTVFIANGAIAGQQSPHFLYHLVPREDNDGLDNFNVPQKDYKDEEVMQYLAPLKGKIGLMMREFKARRNKPVAQAIAQQANPGNPISFEELAKLIQDNPAIKEMLINNPEGFKKELETNPDIKKMFAGLDINKLSLALGTMKK